MPATPFRSRIRHRAAIALRREGRPGQAVFEPRQGLARPDRLLAPDRRRSCPSRIRPGTRAWTSRVTQKQSQAVPTRLKTAPEDATGWPGPGSNRRPSAFQRPQRRGFREGWRRPDLRFRRVDGGPGRCRCARSVTQLSPKPRSSSARTRICWPPSATGVAPAATFQVDSTGPRTGCPDQLSTEPGTRTWAPNARAARPSRSSSVTSGIPPASANATYGTS